MRRFLSIWGSAGFMLWSKELRCIISRPKMHWTKGSCFMHSVAFPWFLEDCLFLYWMSFLHLGESGHCFSLLCSCMALSLFPARSSLVEQVWGISIKIIILSSISLDPLGKNVSCRGLKSRIMHNTESTCLFSEGRGCCWTTIKGELLILIITRISVCF